MAIRNDVLTGGCQCGVARYRVNGEPLALFVCHCRACQVQSGSAFGMSLVVPQAAFDLTAGSLKRLRTDTASGRTKTCAFCPECGVRIYNTTSGTLSIKAGTLDDTTALRPDAHYWTRRAQSWIVLPSDVPCFEET